MINETYLTEIVAKILEQETEPEMVELKRLLLRRIIMESDIKPSRIPAPLNITEIGGYFNLMMKLKQDDMVRQTIAAILGLPTQAQNIETTSQKKMNNHCLHDTR
jgi:hypothetical protein